MSQDIRSSRRSFLKGGALLAAPLAATSVSAIALANDGLEARVTRLENEAAIRELHQRWLQQVNAGEATQHFARAVRRISALPGGEPDSLEIAADGVTAVGRFDNAVELETLIEADCTLAQMAHAQGTGSVRHTERQRLTVAYVKSHGTWTVASATLGGR